MPSLLTLGNLSLGVISIVLAFNNNTGMATLLVFVAILLDGADGWAARKLHVQSEFGKVLDSLSDMITFGAAPAFILYEAAFHELSPALGLGITILFPVCGALRLARFNVENGIKQYFVGLPIPTAGGLLALLSFFKDDIPVIVLLAASLLLSLLMVSSIRYPGFRNFHPSRRTIWVVLLILLILAGGGFLFEKQLYELLFAPLFLYVAYGFMTYMVHGFSDNRKNK
ncbi:CDP-diacylglycerol--serine O-phosphatidyltransferase [Paenibacillus sp. FSL M8-0334]|uniref:CDP-diacylglycerol--serine O-phosphatidyltransferase n=1 Tax=Paenibacillus sp. FSL M8-0334 TaxID=2921623 RepID=UPI000BA57AAF|nr:CDP-diacylglycerol--serine O-phosphatidyltransferase [Paenibacillus sp. 7541]